MPAAIDTAKDWARVRLGSQHACALKTNGALYCWGADSNGQIGNGALASNVPSPTQVGADTDWAAVDVGDAFTCGMKKSGAVLCWGTNADGELGTGVSTHTTPTKIGAGADWKYVAAAGDATCAVTKAGTLACWGNTSSLAGPDLRRQVPFTIGAKTTWATVSVGSGHACATESDGSVSCWGSNGYGQVGTGNAFTVAAPTSVGLKAKSVSAGASHTCAVEADTSLLWCWGDGFWGQLFAPDDSNVPRRATSNDTWSKVAAAGDDSCAIKTDGTAYCVGFGFSGLEQQGHAGATTGFTELSIQPAAEEYYAIQNGAIEHWSWIDSNTLDGAETSWAHVASGGTHRCALRTDGSLACAGNNTYGQLGDGTTNAKTTLATIGAAKDWQQIATGYSHTCGIRNGGELYCWGGNSAGQIGDGSAWSVTPVPVKK